jgi:plasmid maintenance system antidote protein VapI
MVTTIRKGTRPHLYIEEWMQYKGVSDTVLANRLGRARETIYRWRKDQRKLTPEKQADLAEALGIEPGDFWQPPGRPDLNALARDLDDEQHETVQIMVRRLAGRK